MKPNKFMIAAFFVLTGILFRADVSFSAETGTQGVSVETEAVLDGNDEEATETFLSSEESSVESEALAPAASVPAAFEVEVAGAKDENAGFEKEEIKTPEVKEAPQALPVSSPETERVLEPATPKKMRENWDALFSKEITSDSIAYTVKSGDSLYVLAKKYHTTVELIKKLNGMENDALYPEMKLKIYTAPFTITVDKSDNTLILYANGKAVKQYSVATGVKNCTPAGTFKITDKLVNPTWFKTGAILPPGSPENALGTRWMGFDKPEYGIHGTIEPKSIGKQASQGCIRMLNKDVEELYGIVPSGTQVIVQD